MLKKFLFCFLSIASLFLGYVWYIDYFSQKRQRPVIESDEKSIVELQAKVIIDDLDNVASDLQVLAKDKEILALVDQEEPDRIKGITEELLSFLTFKSKYDGLHILDITGHAIMQLRYNRRRPEIVPKDDLQGNGNGAIFEKAILNESGRVYISPLTLSIENNIVEQPLKPVIRFAIPILDRAGNKRGVLILDYLATNLIRDFLNVHRSLNSEPLLLNGEGFWLVGPKPGQLWGLLDAEHQDPSFAKVYPGTWRRIAAADSGQFYSPEGLYTFTTVAPGGGGQPRLNNADPATAAFSNTDDTSLQFRFKILSHVRPEVYQSSTQLPLLSLIIGVGLGLIAAASWMVTRADDRRLRLIAALRQSESRLSNQLRFTETLLDSIPAPVFFKDLQGRYLGCNKAYASVLGLNKDQLVGRTVSEVLPAERAHQHKAMDEQTLARREPQTYEHQMVLADGAWHDVRFFKHAFFDADGKPLGLIGAMLDITEFKRTTELLRRTGRIARVGCWQIDLRDMIPHWSEEVYRIHEVDPNYLPTPQDTINFYPPEVRPVIFRATRRLYEKCIPYDLELPFVTAKGKRLWVRVQAEADEVKEGRAVRLFGSLQDITERKQMEVALQESERRFRNLVENATDSFLVYDMTGKIVDANQRACTGLGYSRQELLALNIMDIDVKASRTGIAILREQWAEVLRGNNLVLETEVICKDGATVPAEVHLGAFQTEENQLLIALARDISARREAEANRRRLAALVESSNDAILSLTAEGEILTWNAAATGIYGYAPEEVIGKSITMLLPPTEEVLSFTELLEKVDHGESVKNHEAVRRCKNGVDIYVSLTLSPISDSEGRLIGLSEIARDVTDYRRALDAIRTFRQALDASSEAIYLVDRQQMCFVDCNSTGCDQLGYDREELLRMGPQQLTSSLSSKELEAEFDEVINKGSVGLLETVFCKKDGTGFPVEVYLHTLQAADKTLIIASVRDITDRKRMEERIKQMAHHDTLTGLPNRNLLNDRFLQCLYRAERERGEFAVLFMDLDRFKAVNDTLGHYMGDLLLQQVANRLKQCVRRTDTVCRLGGDEFVVLLVSLRASEDAALVAKSVRESLNKPFFLDHDQMVNIGVTIGISCYPNDGQTLEDLLKNADESMYQAKQSGRNDYRFYSPPRPRATELSFGEENKPGSAAVS